MSSDLSGEAVCRMGYDGGAKSAPALRKQPGAWPNLDERSDMAERTCSIDGCDRTGRTTRGWCDKHYLRWYRNGDPEDYGSVIRGDAEGRFWSKVVRDPESECLLWTGSLNSYGYGQFPLGRKCLTAHRFVWELSYGAAPPRLDDDGNRLVVDHLCRVRHCVNVDHLEVVTNEENILRGKRPAFARSRTRPASSELGEDGAQAVSPDRSGDDRE